MNVATRKFSEHAASSWAVAIFATADAEAFANAGPEDDDLSAAAITVSKEHALSWPDLRTSTRVPTR